MPKRLNLFGSPESKRRRIFQELAALSPQFVDAEKNQREVRKHLLTISKAGVALRRELNAAQSAVVLHEEELASAREKFKVGEAKLNELKKERAYLHSFLTFPPSPAISVPEIEQAAEADASHENEE